MPEKPIRTLDLPPIDRRQLQAVAFYPDGHSQNIALGGKLSVFVRVAAYRATHKKCAVCWYWTKEPAIDIAYLREITRDWAALSIDFVSDIILDLDCLTCIPSKVEWQEAEARRRRLRDAFNLPGVTFQARA